MKNLSRHDIFALNLPEETLDLYGKTVQVIAGADGDLSQDEREQLFAEASERGVADIVVDSWDDFAWQKHRVAVVVALIRPHLDERHARLLIYDAIRTSRGDGHYPTEEQQAVAKAAALLNVGTDIVRAMEALAKMEESVVELQNAVFDPGRVRFP